MFVCDGPTLKLGDFGIVRQQSDQRGITARTMNALTAPSEVIAGLVPKWQARDDVYQVGQLLAMLVKGDARVADPAGRRPRLCLQRPAEGDHLPLHRRTAETLRERRRADRRAAQAAGGPVDGPAAYAEGRPPRLHRHPVAAARRGGEGGGAGRGDRARRPSARTTVLVRGAPNPLQAAGKAGGLKLMEIKRLREKGVCDHRARGAPVLAAGDHVMETIT